jgi:hypothetical protein
METRSWSLRLRGGVAGIFVVGGATRRGMSILECTEA